MVMDLLDDRLGVFQAFFLHRSGAEVIGRRVVRLFYWSKRVRVFDMLAFSCLVLQ